MKKWMTAILCLVLLCILAIPALADGETAFTVTASKLDAHRGDEITFTVTVAGGAECTSYGLILDYDPNVYELVSGSCTAEGASFKDYSDGMFSVLMDPAAIPAGTVGTFVMKVKADAPFGTSVVSVDASAKNVDAALTCTVSGADVKVSCVHEYTDVCDEECNLCQEKRTAPHEWDAGTVTTEPGCESEGEKTYTCGKCSVTKTEKLDPAGHKYDFDCDTDCNVCGAVREASHSYTIWKHDENNHWQECACGEKGEAEPHEPGAGPTDYDGQDCTVCGRELQPPKGHTHNFGNTWKYDDMGHWKECAGCEEITSNGSHKFDNDCDADCNTCGYKRNPQHIYDEKWYSDVNGHWHQCINCGDQLEMEPHQSGPEATADTPQICVICGYIMAPSLNHTHDFKGDWLKDETGHWKNCAGCGMAQNKQPHNWDEGRITRQPTASLMGRKTFTCMDCGFERSEDVEYTGGTEGPGVAPSDTPSEKPGFPWWIIIVIVAVPVVAGCTYLIIGIVGGKRQSGRYTEK